jgi:hypothetical protein
MFYLTNVSEDIGDLIKNIDSEESKNKLESLKLTNKKWHSNNQIYNILKYDHSILLNELREKTGLIRSVIVNNEGEIVSFSPPKSILFSIFIECYTFEECIAEAFIEGTMINLFFDKNQGDEGEWEIATRSTVGGKISYFIKPDKNENHTFRSMFLEICNHVNLEFDMLNKDYCYSFVIQHPDNRIVSIIKEMTLYLVRVYDINNETLKIEEKNKNDFVDLLSKTEVQFPERYEMNSFNEIVKKYASMNTHFETMGVIFYHPKTGQRAKLRNPNYEDVKLLRGNQPKLQYTYLALRNEGKVKDYLKFYPESKKAFSKFREQIHRYTRVLHLNYMDCYVKKNQPLIEYPYQFRQHMYTLHHTHYLEDLREKKESITYGFVISYINALPSSQLMFTLNYHLRKKKTQEVIQENEKNMTDQKSS